MQADHILNTAVRALIIEKRPADLPADLPIIIAQDIAKTPRPYLLVFCNGGEFLHPKVRKTTLQLDLCTIVDETTATDAALWHAAAAGVLATHVSRLYDLLLADGYKLMRLNLGEYSDEEDPDERGHTHSQAWAAILQTRPI